MSVVVESTPVTVSVSSFTVPGSVLRELLAGAVVAAGKDVTLPTLTGVFVEWSGDGVTAASTDRYRLSVGVAAVSEDSPSGCPGVAVDGEGSALLPRGDVDALIKALPKAPARGVDYSRVSVSLADRVAVVRFDDGDGSWSREVRLIDGDFPRWRGLMPSDADFDASQGVVAVSWDPAYMADVSKIPHGKKCPVRWRFTESQRPALADFPLNDGPVSWRYLLMPMRIAA